MRSSNDETVPRLMLAAPSGWLQSQLVESLKYKTVRRYSILRPNTMAVRKPNA